MAVAQELKKLSPHLEIIYIGQRGDAMADVVGRSPDVDHCYSVSAGKLRRYHGEGIKQLVDFKTMALNSRDGFRVIAGLSQSYRLLKRLAPDVVFIKGGFVGVPVGLAAARLHIPYVTHDSDAIPGLANRLIARWATAHAVALDKSIYKIYDQSKTRTVGVPVRSEFKKVTPDMQAIYKQKIGLEQYKKIILVTGGGLGAERLNNYICKASKTLLEKQPDLAIVHITGAKNQQNVDDMYAKYLPAELVNRVLVKGFVDDMYDYSGAADVIITRAGATTIAEFALQNKACIIIPNPLLTGGHQLKNARYWHERQAAIDVPEADLSNGSDVLEKAINRLLTDETEASLLANNLGQLATPDSARALAEMLLDISNEAKK